MALGYGLETAAVGRVGGGVHEQARVKDFEDPET